MKRNDQYDAYKNARQSGHSEPLIYVETKDFGDDLPEFCDIFINQYGEFVTVFCSDIHGT